LAQRTDAPARPARPIGPFASTARVAPVYLIPLLAATQRAGIASDALFHGLGLVPEDLDVPGFVVLLSEANTVVRRALRLLDVPDLGLMLGMRTRITERGAMALGLMAAATLGDAIALTLEFPGSAGYLMAVHAEQGTHLHRVIADPASGNDDIAPFLVDIMFAGSVRMRRQVTDTHYSPATVELARPRPDNAAAYEKYFGCPVYFARSRNVLASELAGLDHPLPMANPMAYRLSRQLLESEFERAVAASPLGMAAERAIRRALPLAMVPADLAGSLNLGERSLRRKLAQEGLSFRGLLDEARKARALELMAGAGRSITDIAKQTGFSDVRAFSRAFKRWTGRPPSALHTEVHAPRVNAGDSGH
jgi:AraC-like DNA-binding protein